MEAITRAIRAAPVGHFLHGATEPVDPIDDIRKDSDAQRLYGLVYSSFGSCDEPPTKLKLPAGGSAAEGPGPRRRKPEGPGAAEPDEASGRWGCRQRSAKQGE